MPRGERRKRLSDKSRTASFHSFRFQGAQFTGRCFGGGRGVHGLLSSASFTKRIVGWALRMRLTCGDRFSCSPCSGCAYFRAGFPGGARSGLLLWVPSRFAETPAPQRQRQPSHRARRVLRRMGGGKNDRHKRRGCLTRCRRPFFIRTAIRELFRIRNFRRVKKTC